MRTPSGVLILGIVGLAASGGGGRTGMDGASRMNGPPEWAWLRALSAIPPGGDSREHQDC